jgi:hypothetical protein
MIAAGDDELRFAGDINIVHADLIGSKGFLLNVKLQIVHIQIFEDLNSPFMTGNVVLKDSLNLINSIPFIGQEFFRLEVRTPTFRDENVIINHTFYVYKMSDRERIGDNEVVYTLHFISPEALYDMNLRFSKAFEGTGLEIVEAAFKEGFTTQRKLFLKEDTTNKIKFVACNWSPIKTINYACKNSVSKGRSDYVFFENKYGYNYTSMRNLVEITPVYQKFILTKKTREINEQGQSKRNIEFDYTKIVDFDMPVGFDYMDRTLNGMFSSRLITHDYVTKKYSSVPYNLIEEFENQTTLNKFPVYSTTVARNSGAMVMTEAKHYGIHNGFGDISNTEFKLSRISLLKLSEAFKFNIRVAGRTDYTVGMKIAVTMPTFEPHTIPGDPNNVDKMFSGNYLVSAINHHITPSTHECHMELIKDSLIFNLDA